MTNKDKFIEYINSKNDFYAKHGYNRPFEFVSYFLDFNFGVLKETSILSNGSLYVTYCIYVYNEFHNDFIFVQSFSDLNLVEKAFEALKVF